MQVYTQRLRKEHERGGGGSTKQEFVHKIGCPIYTNIHILESNDVTGDICT